MILFLQPIHTRLSGIFVPFSWELFAWVILFFRMVVSGILSFTRKAMSFIRGRSSLNAVSGSGIAVAYYKEMPDKLVSAIEDSLTPDMEDVCKRFVMAYSC